ncbi:hypothetical protein MGYG_05056 [Nannizzia gypsea CBS 118893]|uniref:Uncharacterized protein n=1 Tax=Arthroderma gypseum (strain ATCC MYA-4604 / CBS 118893) TaxID=535722 RepID=E4UY90_ARTGP|nr:hypothetical protein MGYG_05056 [Nannizzia gypsea CBS 118893]EFR02053.1 hypothetical protein MGYG_05056 [Nannizzia gypsea CBS 118893]
MLDKLYTELLLTIISERTRALQHTKDVRISSNLGYYLENISIDPSAPGNDELEINDGLDEPISFFPTVHGFRRFKDKVLSVLHQCKEGNLGSFTWELGSCVPQDILGSNGYLPLKQKNLTSIRLITDASCAPMNYSLSPFTRLTSLSWHGVREREDLTALRECLRVCSHQLVHLDLDFLPRDKIRDGEFDFKSNNSSFTYELLKPFPDHHRVSFPKVRELSLANVSLLYTEELTEAFKFSSMRSLTFRYCPDLEELLEYFLFLDEPFYIDRLEIQAWAEITFEDNPEETDLGTAILNFIGMTRDLKELFLSTSRCPEAWIAIFHHSHTLRNLVFHERAGPEPWELGELLRDAPGPSIMDIWAWENCAIFNADNKLRLEFLGLCCKLEDFSPKFYPEIGDSRVKVLHVRQSGLEIQLKLENDYYRKSYTLTDLLRGKRKIRVREEEDKGKDGNDESNDGNIIPQPVCSGNDHDTTKPSRSNDEATDNRVFPNRALRALGPFATWAFSRAGFRELELLTFGDFSHNGRYSKQNILLCRQKEPHPPGSKNHRHVTKDDTTLLDLFQQYSHALGACPSDLF